LGEHKCLLLLHGIESRFLDFPACSIIIMPTALFRLPVVLGRFQGCLGITVTERTEVYGAIREISLIKLVTIIATIIMPSNLRKK
jgi:hypothetical protein